MELPQVTLADKTVLFSMAKYDDETLVDFLQSLDNSDVEVNEWEAEFIASNLDAFRFTDRQRRSIEEMIEKYGKRIGWL